MSRAPLPADFDDVGPGIAAPNQGQAPGQPVGRPLPWHSYPPNVMVPQPTAQPVAMGGAYGMPMPQQRPMPQPMSYPMPQQMPRPMMQAQPRSVPSGVPQPTLPPQAGGMPYPMHQAPFMQPPQGGRMPQYGARPQPQQYQPMPMAMGRGRGGRGGQFPPPGQRHWSPQLPVARPEYAPLTPTIPSAGRLDAGLVAPKRPEPDQDLIKQFLERYAAQNEDRDMTTHEMLNVAECCDLIDANDVTFVVTDTGTGKSSTVPQELLRRGGRIVSSQPRRTAAINLALRVSALLDKPVGEVVGYSVRGERVGDEALSLMYMTSYTVLLHVISHPTDLKFTHFIIDEFHERQADVEVLLSLLKLAMVQQKQRIKLVLMSASVELEMWKPFFDGLSVGEYNTCKPRYSVHDYYAEEVCRFLGAELRQIPNSAEKVESLDFKNAIHLVERMLTFLAQNTAPEHCVLVFLPGRTNVEQMAEWIKENHRNQLEPIQWYRDVELSVIQEAVNRPTGRLKKVYLATDIAEVSITLPDVVFVLDSGTTKKPRIDPKSRNSVAFPGLDLLWCSRSAVAQRRGRVGRVQQGFFFTMLQEAQLPTLPDMEPQIANCRINELSLHVLEIAANPMAVFNLGRAQPKVESVRLSMHTLLDGGYAMLAAHPRSAAESLDNADAKPWTDFILAHPANATLKGETFVTTAKGVIAQHLPLNIECAHIVYLGLLFEIEALMVLAAAICACGTPYYVFAGQREDSKSAELRDQCSSFIAAHSHNLPSDIVAALDITLEFKAVKREGLTQDGEERWCKDNNVSNFRLQSILTLEKQIKTQLAGQLSYRDVTDIDQLQAMLNEHAPLISLLVCAAHMERGIFISNNAREQQKRRQAGPSIFLGLAAQKDEFVATCVPWTLKNVVIPLSLQLRYDRLLGAFSILLAPRQYNLLLLCFSTNVEVESRNTPEVGESAVLSIVLQGNRLAFQCDKRAAATILEFRRLLALKVRVVRVLAETKVLCDETAALKQHCDELAAKFNIPATDSEADATTLSARLQQAVRMIFDPSFSAELETIDSGELRASHISSLHSTISRVHAFTEEIRSANCAALSGLLLAESTVPRVPQPDAA